MIKRMMYSFAMLLIGIAGAQAQVVISDGVSPTLTAGAVLDLQSTNNKGLLLPHIGLQDFGAWQITDNIEDAVDGTLAHDTISGLDVVYHTTPNANQCHWFPEGLGDNDCRYLLSQSCILYLTGKFGEAGCWMTENLAETAYAYSSPWSALQNIAPVITQAQYRNYNFPMQANPTNATGSADEIRVANLAWARSTNSLASDLGKPGLLYSYNAANDLPDIAIDGGLAQTTNRYPAGRTDTVSRQGICPTGWHLPSDYEWSLLEKEIATNPGSYSSYTGSYATTPTEYNYDPRIYDFLNPGTTTGYRPASAAPADANKATWGNLMRLPLKPSSTTAYNTTNADTYGKSNNPAAGGFSGLLVGNAFSDWYNYGTVANFWSSSTSNSPNGWGRVLGSSFSGVFRNNYPKYYLFSVRCKKN